MVPSYCYFPRLKNPTINFCHYYDKYKTTFTATTQLQLNYSFKVSQDHLEALYTQISTPITQSKINIFLPLPSIFLALPINRTRDLLVQAVRITTSIPRPDPFIWIKKEYLSERIHYAQLSERGNLLLISPQTFCLWGAKVIINYFLSVFYKF